MSRGRIDRDDVSLARLGILEGDNPFELADDMEENDLSSWEQRLRERENGLNERERRLDRRARELDGQRVQSPDDTSPSQNDRIVESLRNLWNEGYDDYDIVVEDIYDYLETVFGTRQ
ncbi:MAG: hypothetical protein GWO20_12710, partial [Candidatus Korarchaeota archaeon]|nr:hypothetical protein [Candidatus Korarchaeota archaeon]